MKFLHSLFSRVLPVVLALLLQILWIASLVLRINDFFRYANILLHIFSIWMVFYIAQKDTKASFKLAWVVPILLFPLFGGLIYLFFGTGSPTRKMQRKLQEAKTLTQGKVPDSEAVIEELSEQDPAAAGQMRYLQKIGGFPAYQHTECRYFPSGEAFWESLLEEMKKAKRFIFLEFFIIADGKMWNSILEILEEKVKEGVEVRVMYDDIGSLTTLSPGYDRLLMKKGIQCIAFNPFKPILSIVMNNRDHRKIAVIDGKVGFTGGVNFHSVCGST